MHKVTTRVLFLSGVMTWLAAAVAFRPGQVLLEAHSSADIRQNWLSVAFLLTSVLLFCWCLIRAFRYLYRRFYAQPQRVD